MSVSRSITIENIYYMLAYAFKAVGMDEFKLVGVEKFDNAEDLLAAILVVGIGKVVRGGLHRTFVPVEQDLKTLRGNLQLTQTIKNLVRRKQVLSCKYDEFTSNNTFNQIIRTTIGFLLNLSFVKQERKLALRKLLPFFSCVDFIEPSRIDWSRLVYQRNNKSYVVLMNLCRLILDACIMGDKDGSGNTKLQLFDEDRLSSVYESFLREYYRVHHPEIEVPGAKELNWDASAVDRAKLPKLITDVMLKSGDKVLIIDAKFYGEILQHKFGGASYRNANLCQINTYVQSAKADPVYAGMKIDGMLLYAQTTEKVQSDSFTISGNFLSVVTIDLGQKFSLIAKQLDDIVNEWK